MAVRLSLDDILTYIGWYMIAVPPVVLLVLYRLPENVNTEILPFAIALLVAVPVTICYQRAEKSLGDLGTFVFATAALNVVFGLSLAIAFRTFGTVLGTEEPSIPAVTLVIAVEYTVGYYLVYRDGYARLKSALAESV